MTKQYFVEFYAWDFDRSGEKIDELFRKWVGEKELIELKADRDVSDLKILDEKEMNND